MRKKNRMITNTIMLIITLILVVPLWYVVNNAFKQERFIYINPLILTPESFSLEGIFTAFRIMKYPLRFFNSLAILLVSCIIIVSVGSMAAYGIAMAKNKYMKRIYNFIVILITLPIQLAMVPLIFMMKDMHLINTHLGTALVYSGWFLPFVIFLYTGFIRKIPKELEEAARVDGCGLLRSFISIYMPLLKTITGTVLILRGVPIWNGLLVPMITLTRSTLTTLPYKLYTFIGGDSISASWDLVFAGTFLVSMPILIIFLAMQRVFITGAMAGAVKG